ncbi:olfactory receptor 2T29-like [Discoglossus pictus]
MYFFLCNLSVLDILYISSTLPKLLFISYTGNNRTSFAECITQLYFFLFFADTESFLLTSMAFDRYVAICMPLHYSMIMNKNSCGLLAFTAWFMGAVNAWILTRFVIELSFCGLNEINNFFCDLKALLTISCSDTSYLRHFIFVDGTCIGAIPLFLTLASYVCIISTVFKIRTSDGRFKAFSSCTSHLTAVILYYGSALCLYMRSSPEQDKYLSLLFVTLVPVFNPLVYSLRNKDILGAMKKVKKEWH